MGQYDPSQRGSQNGSLSPIVLIRMAGFVADFSLAGMRALVQNRKGYEGALGTFAFREVFRRKA